MMGLGLGLGSQHMPITPVGSNRIFMARFGSKGQPSPLLILPISTAARKFRKDPIGLLLAHGAQIYNTGKGKISPLRIMAAAGSHLDKALRMEIYEYMVSRGAIALPTFTVKEEKSARQYRFAALIG